MTVMLDWLMKMPLWLNSLFFDEIETIEEREKVEYITSIERIGIAKGMSQGMAQGRVEGESRLLKRQLERRFGMLPEWAAEKLSRATEQELEAWAEAILTAQTLEGVFIP
ncbi:MAG: hypothetical protein A3K90_08800 [Pelodictyon luteolum]|uniref:DUF4351 domain-containing protein n=2 Tax=Pelodictyon luteolum TaxID=1100 RepID=A0A165LVE7_PELLU|nr:MAG: hypothetical protein A3K90_08800 [Pelodictyon luteolum]